MITDSYTDTTIIIVYEELHRSFFQWVSIVLMRLTMCGEIVL